MSRIMQTIFYAQSGGVTSVINQSLVGLIRSARQHNMRLLVGLDGIHGLLTESFFDTASLSEEDLSRIAKTPGGSFGSCRRKLKESDHSQIIHSIKKYSFDAIIYQGGNDSQSTLNRINQLCLENQISCQTIGLPKTIDNDLMETDLCPGFGSAARFLTLAARQLCLDLSSMCRDSTKVYIIETMGRHTGWLAASVGLSHQKFYPGPQIILVPERTHSQSDLLSEIEKHVQNDGYCCICVSEGYSPTNLHNHQDSFGHATLQGSGLGLKALIENQCGFKTRLCIPDYLQRSFGLLCSSRDAQQSYMLGEKAIELLLNGCSGHMITIQRHFDHRDWSFSTAPLATIADKERHLPLEYLSVDGWTLSDIGRQYFTWALGPDVLQEMDYFWPHIRHHKSCEM
ncbi:MAG: diphosphate--fructose-6-phosphate 1-phosphotransferase [Gammaproteobacteria bacterium]|nr:diphosphate--fructose-6-phosphate 1-phosphotransferase [Gammaproteobacteria bacterium]